ncbi:DEAH-box nuclear pre-mRNA splicing factor [Volvox carteri f. nagariensis]|uniref:RNA helicase n=1 Tax=Volvox carteri f. nagariensis TaxID=3068 RepID=D8U3W7_VOLCA|nr:DEAH-box nuclear pre-mRNA splicing factor [Volvox carteri f. nagariensis]EFJ45602.1 DEAH-box nuclear pre-mRNA splicing factor [Volvox carteri f. nagariensis]|eukprot:XP_002953292.1 DEAH-box nuclear pre-mRNA splicing factor [Volvox carteri f. nagariensis]
MTVARRVAEEMGTKLGHKVGYAIRFEDVTSPSTSIKYMTDGLLLREALVDPLLSRYRIVIIDEAHERTVHTDVLFGLLKGVQRTLFPYNSFCSGPAQCSLRSARPDFLRIKSARRGDDFRLIVMSATLDAARFVDYFPGAVAALIRGRQFPVQVMYTAKPEDNYLDAAINATLQVHTDEGEGDILVFLTGQDEIDSAERLLKVRNQGSKADPCRELLVLPIYAALPPEQQMKVFEPAPEGQRKAILATNIAETSITIPGVRYVIDTGHVKARDYNAKLGLESLAVVPVSQAQARQRSGRAGREGPGKAFRLYTESDFSSLAPVTPPEITRCNLGSVVLQLKAMGIQDVLGFDFMDPPPRAAILRSLELLYALGALDSSGRLTEGVGSRLARLPVDPMFGRVLLAACEMGCGQEGVAVVAMVSTDNVFHTPRAKEREWRAARLKFLAREGDHLTLLNVFRGFRELPKDSHKARTTWCSDNFINIRAMRKAEDIYDQLVRFLGPPSPPGLGLALVSCGDDTAPLRRALTAGLFPHAARLQPDGSYRVLATGRQVFLHPSSVLLDRKPDCLVFNELMHTTRTYARDAVAIEARWLPELAPAVFAAKAGAAAASAAGTATGAAGGTPTRR